MPPQHAQPQAASQPQSAARPTPLLALHREWRAHLADFAGWRLPLSYPQGAIAEHNAARRAAAIFDVSHMAQVVVRGENAARALARILPADIPAIPPGKSKYAVMLNHDGGALDDLIVANDGPRGFFIVCNAARRDHDLRHLRENLPPDCELQEITDRALVAVQGPAAEGAVRAVFPGVVNLRFMDAEWFSFENGDARVSRSGYTGEDGFEISVPAENAEALCRVLAENESVRPAGLGARDTLRTEAALCLYGHEIGEDFSPLEAGLLWTIPKSRRESGNFIGCESVRETMRDGAKRKLIGLRPDRRSIVRGGAPLMNQKGESIGAVSSGVFSPTLQAPVALGFVRTPAPAVGETVLAEVRGKRVACEVSRTPFVPRNHAVGKP